LWTILSTSSWPFAHVVAQLLARNARKGRGENPHRVRPHEVAVLENEQGTATSPGVLPTPARRVPAVPPGAEDLADPVTDVLALEHEHFDESVRDLDGWTAEDQAAREESDRFAPERKERIKAALTFGEDLSPEEKRRATELCLEYADVWALALSEVRAVDGIEHRLEVPAGTRLPTNPRAQAKAMTEPQRDFFYQQVDALEAAGFIRKITAEDVQCINSTNLAPKDRAKPTLTQDELERRANTEAERVGVPYPFDPRQRPPFPPDHVASPEAESSAPAKWRVCHAFTALNRHCKIPAFPTGDLEVKKQKLAGHPWYFVLDMHSGYFAIKMREEDVGKTAFRVEGRGFYAYTRMPFGLHGAPATFQELVSRSFSSVLATWLESWMDDLASGSDSVNTMLGRLRIVLELCRKHGLSLAPAKAKIGMRRAPFGGSLVDIDGVHPDPSKVSSILDYPRPTTAHGVLMFLSTVGYFRNAIPNFADIAIPLVELTKGIRVMRDSKPGQWKDRGAYKRALQETEIASRWTDEHERAMVQLKLAITTDPVLVGPSYDRPFIIGTDASARYFAAFIGQQHEKIAGLAAIHPIAFASRQATDAESRYHPFIGELAAIKWALDKFYKYVYGQRIIIESDAKAVVDFLRHEHLPPAHARWKEAVLGHNIIDVRHRPGATNPVDSLTRLGASAPPSTEAVEPGWEAETGLVNDLCTLEADWSDWPTVLDEAGEPSALLGLLERESETSLLLERFAEDPFFRPIVETLKGCQPESWTDTERGRYLSLSKSFFIEDSRLWKVLHVGGGGRVECLTEGEALERATREHADNGHMHRDLVMSKLRQRVFRPHLVKTTELAIKSCRRCVQFGPRLANALLRPVVRARPFERFAADYLSMPKGKGGYKTILLVIDWFTRWVWGFKLRTAGTGATTVAALKHIALHYGKPEVFGSDGGSHFKCEEVANWCIYNLVVKLFTPEYTPKVNGLVEGTNHVLLDRLRRACAKDTGEEFETASIYEWPTHFDTEIAHINDYLRAVTGYTPRGLLFATMARGVPTSEPQEEPSSTDVDVQLAFADELRWSAVAQSALVLAQRKARVDKRVRRPEVFKVGDLVMTREPTMEDTKSTTRKLARKWLGPRRITKVGGLSCWVETLEGQPVRGRFHVNRLKKVWLGEPREQEMREESAELEEESEEDDEELVGSETVVA
jgi:transposase InsO family protein